MRRHSLPAHARPPRGSRKRIATCFRSTPIYSRPERPPRLPIPAHHIEHAGLGAGARALAGLAVRHTVALARGEEQVLLEPELAVIEIAIAAAERMQRLVRAALDDAAFLDHQDLIRATDRRKPVRDHERRPPLHQVLEPGVDNAEMRPMIVLFPEPLEPTSAVTVPAGETNDTSFSTGLSASYAKSTPSKPMSPRTGPSASVRLGSSSSARLSSTSRVRSRPASGSVSCVPIATIWKMGAIRKPRNMV